METVEKIAPANAPVLIRGKTGSGKEEVALTGAQTRLAVAQYDYKIAKVTLAYAAGSTAGSGAESVSR